jgi:hypothetical protein
MLRQKIWSFAGSGDTPVSSNGSFVSDLFSRGLLARRFLLVLRSIVGEWGASPSHLRRTDSQGGKGTKGGALVSGVALQPQFEGLPFLEMNFYKWRSSKLSFFDNLKRTRIITENARPAKNRTRISSAALRQSKPDLEHVALG